MLLLKDRYAFMTVQHQTKQRIPDQASLLVLIAKCQKYTASEV